MKKSIALILFVYLAAAFVTNSQTASRPPGGDVKIRQRISSGNSGGAETVLYIKGPRMRSEMAGSMGFTTILQCDLKRTLTINERTKSYMIAGTDGATAGAGDGGAPAPVTTPNDQPATP